MFYMLLLLSTTTTSEDMRYRPALRDDGVCQRPGPVTMIACIPKFRLSFMQKQLRHKTAIAGPGQHPASGTYLPAGLKHGRAGKPAPAAAILARIIAPGLMTACLWSKVWLPLSGTVLLTVGAVLFLVFVPALLGSLGSRINWTRLVGFGERIWLNRLSVPVPQDLNYRLTILYLVFWTGGLVALWGGLASLPILSLSGLAVAYSAQATCFGKLIQLYTIMRERHPLYRFWSAFPVNDNKPLTGHDRSACG